jgi:site-specific recombinase XerC
VARTYIGGPDIVSVHRLTDAHAELQLPLALTPTEAVDLILDALEFRALRDQSTTRLADLFDRFVAYVERGHGCATLADVSQELIEGFVHAPTSGEQPSPRSVASMHFRRSAIRLLFRLARRLGLVEGDPTLDLRLPLRSSLRRRPLTDDEVLICRSFALATLTETRQPAAWALAEATARTAEIPRIRVSNVELDAVRVFIPGEGRTLPRWGYLTEWGVTQIDRRLRVLNEISGDPHLVYSGGGGADSAQASSCAAISAILVRAGLGREPDVGPGSVAAWAGAEAHERGLPIEYVARMLGVRSLDRAARFIGWDWRSEG